MGPENNKFKLILTAVFGFFIILGLVAFSTFKSNSAANTQTNIAIWGTVPQTIFDNFVSKYKQDNNIDFKLTYTEKPIGQIDGDLVEAIATGERAGCDLDPARADKKIFGQSCFRELNTTEDIYRYLCAGSRHVHTAERHFCRSIFH